MEYDVYFQKELDKSYSIIINGEVYNTPLVNEDDMAFFVEDVDNYLYTLEFNLKNVTTTFKLTDEEPPVGFIIDVFREGDEVPFETSSYWFDDYN